MNNNNNLLALSTVLLMLIEFAFCGLIEHHEGATSYQNIEIEHFHPVPTFIKKEHKHLLEHPVSLGKSTSKVEIHHGNKHDHGYAIASVENDAQHHQGFEGYGDVSGHEEANYQVQPDQYAQFELGAADFGHYQQELAAAQAYQHQDDDGGHE